MKEKKYKIVVLDCPHLIWDDPLVQEIFVKTIQLKRAGYMQEYQKNVLAYGTTDFVGTNQLVCEDVNGVLTPLLGYKIVNSKVCEEFNLSFPAIDLLRASNAPDHLKALEEILSKNKKSNTPISYDGSFTIHPTARADRQVAEKLRDIMKATHVLYHLDYGIPRIVAGGNVRFKMERLYNFWGYESFSLNGKILPPIKAGFAHGEAVIMYYLENFSKEAIQFAETFRSLWEDRLVLSPTSNKDAKLKIAA